MSRKSDVPADAGIHADDRPEAAFKHVLDLSMNHGVIPRGDILAWLTWNQITGQPCLTPRLATVPVRMPLPPPPDNSSIFKTQQSAGARSAFA